MKISFLRSEFCDSENGTIAILWAMSLVVFFGLIALVFGIGRIGITHGELQSYADAVALAAAGELDGNDDAITRATAAAANLISDTQTFGTDANGDPVNNTLSGVGDYVLSFHSDLPASDLTALGADITNDPALAAFAQVTVNPHSIAMPFLTATAALLGNNNGTIRAAVTAEAVAGFTQEACDITPLMFCLPPAEPVDLAAGQTTYSAENHVGSMINLRSGGAGSAWGPGDFGFLDPSGADLGATCSGLTGVNLIACLIGAEQNVTKCFTQRGVDTSPGQQVGIEDALFNVRFDIYKSIMNGERNDAAYAPAPNVISGLVPQGGGSCIGQNEQQSPDTMALPQDDCLIANNCGRFGDGNWNEALYLTTNHATTALGVLAELSAIQANLLQPTRFEMYRAEIAYADSLGQNHAILDPLLAETGRGQCNTNPSISGVNRRVVIAAGIDCTANPINGAENNVPVAEFFEMFLTEPVGDDGTSPPTLDLWIEIIGSAGGTGYSSAGNGGIFRDVVQLYR